MTRRSVPAVFVLALLTGGLYAIVWHVQTKRELAACGARVPTCWLMLVPFVNLVWLWEFCGGVEHVTRGRVPRATGFALELVGNLLLPFVGMAAIQAELNHAIDRGLPEQLPVARVVT